MHDQSLVSILLLILQKESDRAQIITQGERLAEEDWQSLIELASKLGVSNILYYLIKTRMLIPPFPSKQLEVLRKEHLANGARNLVNNLELVQIAKAFTLRQIPLIVLKGAFLAEFIYPYPAMRAMSDIDILVHVEDLSRAADVLNELQYQAEYKYVTENIPATIHHLPGFVKKGGPKIELHWTILTVEDRRPVDVHVLWQRASSIQIANAGLLALCPEDLLLHLCGHASYHHNFEVGLRALFDVLMTIEHYHEEIDWPAFIVYTKNWYWERGVYVILRLAKDLLGASVPDMVLQSTMPSDWDESMLETAKVQILKTDSLAGEITFPLANWHAANLSGKIIIFWKRLFLPKTFLAARFRTSPSSPFIFFYYPVRFFDLLFRYGKIAYKLWQGSASSIPFVERKAKLQEWLGEKRNRHDIQHAGRSK